MRLNKYISENTSYSRRKADHLISIGSVTINNKPATLGQEVNDQDQVFIDDKIVRPIHSKTAILILNKPVGYVCSRNGQGSKTVYDILPLEFRNYNYIGRLDKDSSGLILLTNSGQLVNELSHPSNQKLKTYNVMLDKPLNQNVINTLNRGVKLADGTSKIQVTPLYSNGKNIEVTMIEGRNRQIRRTFESLGFKVVKLHRIKFADYILGNLKPGAYILK